MPRPAWLALVLVAAVALGAFVFVRDANEQPTLRVAAASDLRGAFDEIAALFEAECECRVVLTFGSSGTLSRQIREGLPVDVFASANADFVDRLDREGLLLPETRRLYAIGRIVLATPVGSGLSLSRIEDLTAEAVRRIAIANPGHAPYGMAAQQALEAAGLWQTLQPRLVLGENASIATEYVQSGNVDAGILPLSLAMERSGAIRWVLIDDGLHEPLHQVMAAIGRSRNPDLARSFIAFVGSAAGQEVMQRHGFVLPQESGP